MFKNKLQSLLFALTAIIALIFIFSNSNNVLFEPKELKLIRYNRVNNNDIKSFEKNGIKGLDTGCFVLEILNQSDSILYIPVYNNGFIAFEKIFYKERQDSTMLEAIPCYGDDINCVSIKPKKTEILFGSFFIKSRITNISINIPYTKYFDNCKDRDTRKYLNCFLIY
jgi:hypothetical protein